MEGQPEKCVSWWEQTGKLATLLGALEDDNERASATKLVSQILDRVGGMYTMAMLDRLGIMPWHLPLLMECFSPHIGTLKNVILARNDLGDEGLEPVLKALLDAPHLQQLDLSETRLFAVRTPSLFELIKNSTTLKMLSLSHNPLSTAFDSVFGPALACNTDMTSLDMNGIHLLGPVFSALWRHPKLRWLSMDRCLGQLQLEDVSNITDLFQRNNVLEVFSMEDVRCPENYALAIFRSLTHNTGLARLHMRPLLGSNPGVGPTRNAHQVGSLISEAVTSLLLTNVTLEQLPPITDDTQKELKRNMVRKCSRINRARRAFIALEGLRRFRRLPALRFIGRDIMCLIGRLIVRTKLRVEWEDPVLWPKPWPADPCYERRWENLPASFRGEPALVRDEKRRKYGSAKPGDRMGPWRRTPGGDWEYFGRGDDDNEDDN